MTKSQINILKRLMKSERSCIIDYGGKEVLVSGAVAVITLEKISEALGFEVDQERKGLSNIIDSLIQPCYTSELRTFLSVPDFIQFIKESSDAKPIFDFGPDRPAVQAKLLKDCISIIGEKKIIEISFNPDRPLMNGMLIYSSDRPQTMCILMPVKKGNK